jgi:hypothetical protein
MPRAPIPHRVSFNQERTWIHVEAWFGQRIEGEPGTGYLRCFDAASWPRAAYIGELKAGRVTGAH